MSRNAAACGEVTIPIRCGKVGIGFLRLAVEQPFRLQLGLELLKCNLQRARALGLKVLG